MRVRVGRNCRVPCRPRRFRLGRGDVGFGAADHIGIGRRAAARIAPGIIFLKLVGLVDIGGGERDSERVVGELVDERRVDPVALVARAGIELAEIGIGAARADREDLAAAEIERPDGADVDGADQALADQAGARRLVDVDLADDLRRILVELDGAVVAGRGLLAAVQQGHREIGAEAADRDDVGAARQALRGQAGKAGDRFGDRGVGELADILGRDRLDDLVLLLLLVDGAFERRRGSR